MVDYRNHIPAVVGSIPIPAIPDVNKMFVEKLINVDKC